MVLSESGGRREGVAGFCKAGREVGDGGEEWTLTDAGRVELK